MRNHAHLCHAGLCGSFPKALLKYKKEQHGTSVNLYKLQKLDNIDAPLSRFAF